MDNYANWKTITSKKNDIKIKKGNYGHKKRIEKAKSEDNI